MPMKSFFASARAGALIFAAGAASAQTVGPSGETATPSADITLSALRGQDIVLVFYCFDWGSI